MRDLQSLPIVIASHNVGKLREFENLLHARGIKSKSAAELGIAEPAETESSFADNARLKAHHTFGQSGLPSLADDSGLTVDALNGDPGVRTADWADGSNGRDFGAAMAKVWKLLEDMEAPEPRTAQFRSTLCMVWPDGSDEYFEGVVEGRLIWPTRGTLGFGFDPMFVPAGYNLTFGEMPPREKNAISHRAVAIGKFLKTCFVDRTLERG